MIMVRENRKTVSSKGQNKKLFKKEGPASDTFCVCPRLSACSLSLSTRLNNKKVVKNLVRTVKCPQGLRGNQDILCKFKPVISENLTRKP